MLAALDRLSLLLTERRQRLDSEVKRLRARQTARVDLIGRLADRLDAHRRERDAAIERREELRSELAALDVSDAERRTKCEAIVEMLRTDLTADAEAALGAPLPMLPDGVTPTARLRALRSELSRARTGQPSRALRIRISLEALRVRCCATRRRAQRPPRAAQGDPSHRR